MVTNKKLFKMRSDDRRHAQEVLWRKAEAPRKLSGFSDSPAHPDLGWTGQISRIHPVGKNPSKLKT
jgi:hypothetical protein